jgi:hypothetical protein
MTGRYVKLVFYTVINRRGVLVRSHNLRFTGHITEIGHVVNSRCLIMKVQAGTGIEKRYSAKGTHEDRGIACRFPDF